MYGNVVTVVILVEVESSNYTFLQSCLKVKKVVY